MSVEIKRRVREKIMTSSTPLKAWSPVPPSAGRPPEEDDISAFNSPTGSKPVVLLNAVIDPLTTPENELIYGAWTASYHSVLSIHSKEVIEVVDNQLDKINIASEYVPYVLYPYLGARIAAGAFFMIHGAYRLRDNRTFYKVAANMFYEDVANTTYKVRKRL